MSELIKKISSYNIFNFLFPGILFVYLTKILFSINLLQDNIFIGVFLYYFIGLVISRVGSLVIEPVLKIFNLLKFADYSDYIKASKKDSMLELFSEVNNMYRTLSSLFVCIFIFWLYLFLSRYYNLCKSTNKIIMLLTFMSLFVYSYIKQSNYITKRIHTAISKKGKH